MSLGERIKAKQGYLDKWIEEHKDASTEEIEEFARERVSTLPDRIKAEDVDYEAELKGYTWDRIKEYGIVGLLFTFLLFMFSPFPNNKLGNSPEEGRGLQFCRTANDRAGVQGFRQGGDRVQQGC